MEVELFVVLEKKCACPHMASVEIENRGCTSCTIHHRLVYAIRVENRVLGV